MEQPSRVSSNGLMPDPMEVPGTGILHLAVFYLAVWSAGALLQVMQS